MKTVKGVYESPPPANAVPQNQIEMVTITAVWGSPLPLPRSEQGLRAFRVLVSDRLVRVRGRPIGAADLEPLCLPRHPADS